MREKICFYLLTLASIALAADTPVDRSPSRLPEPASEAQQQAEKKLREVYRPDYSARTPQALRSLAAKLLAEGPKNAGDPAMAYLHFREARDLAVQAGDPSVALQAIAETAKMFQVDAAAMRRSTLTAASRTVQTPEDSRRLAEGCLASGAESLAAGECEGARKLAGIAGTAAKAARDANLAACSRGLTAEVGEVAAWQEKARAAEKRLREAPDDPAANLTLGKFLCLYLRDWTRGLPYFTKGSDAALLKLAEEDRAGPSAVERQLEVGEAWLNFANKARGREKDSLLLRSGHWYARAAAEATGLPREGALNALEAIAAQAPDPQPPLPGAEPSPGLVIVRFNGKDLRGWDVLSGTWRVQAGNLAHAGGIENRLLMSWGQARWLRVRFEFQGGNPGIYFGANRTDTKGPGINLDSEARNNGEIRTAVDMQAWNVVLFEYERGSMRVLLNGREVFSGHGGAPTCVLVKAQRGELRVRKLVAVGWNPEA